jgi:hypothetical protein
VADLHFDSWARRSARGSPIIDGALDTLPNLSGQLPRSSRPLDCAVTLEVTRSHILPIFAASDFLSLDAIQNYFELAIWQAGPKTDQWDKHHIVSGDMPCFPPTGKFRAFLFKTAAERFNLIPS